MSKMVTKEELDVIMQRWQKYAKAVEITQKHKTYLPTEQAFLWGAFCQILQCGPEEVTLNVLPPVVSICFTSGRPVSSVWKAP